jgi:hypothetical protein
MQCHAGLLRLNTVPALGSAGRIPMAALAVVLLGCGGGGGDGPTSPSPEQVFSALYVIPAAATICTAAPGNVVSITATPKDQSGQPMSGLGQPSYTNSDPGTVTVDPGGRVTAVAQGSAQVTASLTGNGTTRTAVATITVADAPTGDVTGSVSDNHPLAHIAVITAAQLTEGSALTLSIQGQAFHSHTLALTDVQMAQIAAGCRTFQASSENPHSDGSGSHTHVVSFN